MAYVGKTYKFAKDENFKSFLDSLGISADKVEAIANSKPTQKLEKNGDTYVITTIDSNGTKQISFKDGVEFDEDVNTVPAKTTITVDGNIFNQVQKFSGGRTITLRREFSDSGLVVTLQNSGWDGTAKRYYDAV